MRYLYIDGYRITAPILSILQQLKLSLTNGKLREIKPSGDNIVVTCPNALHANGREQTAACNVYIGDNPKIKYGYARCFVCGFEKSFPGFVAECFSSSLQYAKRWLIENFGEKSEDFVDLGEDIHVNLTRRSILKPVVPQKDPRLEEIASLPSWCPYLQRRRLSRNTCEEFGLKYDHKSRKIIFPCFNQHKQLVMLPTRNVDTKVFYLDKDVEKPLYCIDKITEKHYDKVMIVEGPFDTLSCWEHGVPAVGTFGNPSDAQIAAINNSCITTVYLGFDNDTWGQKFADIVRAKLDKRILVITVNYPKGIKDPNELPHEAWKQFIEINNLPKIK